MRWNISQSTPLSRPSDASETERSKVSKRMVVPDRGAPMMNTGSRGGVVQGRDGPMDLMMRPTRPCRHLLGAAH